MDATNIDFSTVSDDLGFRYGKADAPVKLYAYLNVECPFSRKFEQQNTAIIQEFVEAGKVQYIVKPIDRPTGHLRKGNVMHSYLTYDDPENAFKQLTEMFATRQEWTELDEAGVAAYAENQLGYTKQDHDDTQEAIKAEAVEVGAKTVPTAYVFGQAFDEHEDNETIREWFNAAYQTATATEVYDFGADKLDLDQVTDKRAIKYGQDDAPIKVTEYINFRCQGSKNFEDAVSEKLEGLADEGKIQRIIKHVDIDKAGLAKGEVINRFVDYKDQEKAYKQFKEIFARHGEWKTTDFGGIVDYAIETLSYQYQGNRLQNDVVKAEFEALGGTATPTIVVNNDKAFVGPNAAADLIDYLDEQIAQ
ncbi:thioredoxin domain-containing protein [Aerococcus urinaeequi]|uniref:thioredoxin domain-containing protein n=1 Tax=Aerococcus urinaeequi TaxID=51665 RepID=UPI0022E090EC|nr:thioredoxin domain-containing protein [Aerococcus urinaeequi]